MTVPEVTSILNEMYVWKEYAGKLRNKSKKRKMKENGTSDEIYTRVKSGPKQYLGGNKCRRRKGEEN